MTETKPIAVNMAFSLTLEHVGKLADLQEHTGMNKSELVRLAIDKLFATIDELPAIEQPVTIE